MLFNIPFLKKPWDRYANWVIYAILFYTGLLLFKKYAAYWHWEITISDKFYIEYLPIVLSIAMLDVTYHLGIQQAEIQKKQYQLDKFNTYEELHQALYRLEYISHQVLQLVYKYVTSTWGEFDKKLIEKALEELELLELQLSKEEANYLLRHGDNQAIKEVSTYCSLASTILILTLDKIPLPETANQGSNTERQLFEAASLRDYKTAYNAVQQAMKERELSPQIVSAINFYVKMFVKESERLFENENILQKIRDLYNQ